MGDGFFVCVSTDTGQLRGMIAVLFLTGENISTDTSQPLHTRTYTNTQRVRIRKGGLLTFFPIISEMKDGK